MVTLMEIAAGIAALVAIFVAVLFILLCMVIAQVTGGRGRDRERARERRPAAMRRDDGARTAVYPYSEGRGTGSGMPAAHRRGGR
jgi:hypothetical protein